MKYFTSYTRPNEQYNYAQIRANSIKLYKMVSNCYFNTPSNFSLIMYNIACILYRQQFFASAEFI